ncbi:MAG: PhnD/SsuA/transferrin family substrate-binding protein, partial [Planctomycetota bacterium]|nr:PhnD/SsuA/transferrin family substrate-binding protein [Planctomycetota bacterium]
MLPKCYCRMWAKEGSPVTSTKRLEFVAMVALLFNACARTEPQETPTLRFAAIPDQTSTELQEKFRPFSQYLSRELGVAVEYVPARDYQASVEMFKNGDVLLS